MKYSAIEKERLKEAKYKIPQIVESGLLFYNEEEWPSEEIRGNLPVNGGPSEWELLGVRIKPNGLPMFLDESRVKLFKKMLDAECPIEDLRTTKKEDKQFQVVEAMLSIQNNINDQNLIRATLK